MVNGMDVLANKLAERYGGIVALPHECTMYLREDQQLLFGIRLNDAKSNYELLTKYDLMNLSDTTRYQCVKTKTSPFNNMLLIVYKTKYGNTEFKLLHGMASRLVAEMVVICEHYEESKFRIEGL